MSYSPPLPQRWMNRPAKQSHVGGQEISAFCLCAWSVTCHRAFKATTLLELETMSLRLSPSFPPFPSSPCSCPGPPSSAQVLPHPLGRPPPLPLPGHQLHRPSALQTRSCSPKMDPHADRRAHRRRNGPCSGPRRHAGFRGMVFVVGVIDGLETPGVVCGWTHSESRRVHAREAILEHRYI